MTLFFSDDWLSSPSPGSVPSSAPPLSPSPGSQIHNYNTSTMSNGYSSPMSTGSYDPYSPNSKLGKSITFSYKQFSKFKLIVFMSNTKSTYKQFIQLIHQNVICLVCPIHSWILFFLLLFFKKKIAINFNLSSFLLYKNYASFFLNYFSVFIIASF